MSERPTQTPASSARQPQASGAPTQQASRDTPRDGLRIEGRGDDATAGPRHRSSQPLAASESLAVRAERFRNGAPFLVERATLYDPDPLDLPVAPADRRLGAPRALLPAALTLLGIVIFVGLAAGVLFVRNADGPRTDEAQDRRRNTGRETGPSRLDQFSEGVMPRSLPATPSRPDTMTYDLTRRANDTIVGAWRAPKDVKGRTSAQGTPTTPTPAPPSDAVPIVVTAPAEPPPTGLRRLLPRRFTSRAAKQAPEPVAEVAPPSRAPLDDPYVPNASAQGQPTERRPDAQDTASAPRPASDASRRRPMPGATERPESNVVARVGRATDPRQRDEANGEQDTAPPIASPETDKPKSTRDRYTTSRAKREQQRRQREARRRAIDLDRFLVRDKGDIPNGFVFSGPQGQRP